jgi:hypothetical protein
MRGAIPSPLNTSSWRGIYLSTGTSSLLPLHYQNTIQNHNLLLANKSFENVAKLKRLETTIKSKVAFTKKLRADHIREMLAIILF